MTTQSKIAIYARVSTDLQSRDAQLRDLRDYVANRGWANVREFVDEGVSGSKDSRPAWNQLWDAMQKGRVKVLVVHALDRLGRSLPHLVEIINGLREAGIGFRSLQEQIDTTNAGGRFYFHMLAALAEFEREMISERTKAGMASARRRGKHIGRPRKLSAQQVAHARELIDSGKETRAAAAALFGVDAATLRRALHRGG